MLATLLGPELEAAGPAELPPQAASVMATVTRIIGKRFMLLLPYRSSKARNETLPEL